MVENVQEVLAEASAAAIKVCDSHMSEYGDRGLCGFAWCEVTGVRSNSKLGKQLLSVGFQRGWRPGMLYKWNPGNFHGQSIDGIERGAVAYSKVLREKLGIAAYAASRLD